MRLTRAWSLPLRALALMAPLGCGPTVSLDDPAVASSDGSGTSTGAGPFGPLLDDGPTPGSLDDGPRLDFGAVKLDVAPDIPLGPGSCPPDCQLELELEWSYYGFAGGAGPRDPEDRVAVVLEPGGTRVVAEERQGELELARLSSTGQELWTLPLSLPCDPCRLVDLGLLPSGDLLLAGHGMDATGMPVALAARVELGGPQLVWATASVIASASDQVAPRAGSLVAHDDLLFQPVLASPRDGRLEQLELFAYDPWGGGLLYAEPIAASLASGNAPPPLAVYDSTGTLVVTHPSGTGIEGLAGGTVRWLATSSGDELASDTRIEPSLGLVASSDGRVLTLGQTPGETQSLLYLDNGSLDALAAWQVIHVLPTVTSTAPALALDGFGHAHVAVRSAQGAPGREVAAGLELIRWAEDGELVWKVSLPVALDPVDEPVSLAIAPDGALVLAGFVAGARHVEQRLPRCDCR